jgi:hypothetical protein
MGNFKQINCIINYSSCHHAVSNFPDNFSQYYLCNISKYTTKEVFQNDKFVLSPCRCSRRYGIKLSWPLMASNVAPFFTQTAVFISTLGTVGPLMLIRINSK